MKTLRLVFPCAIGWSFLLAPTVARFRDPIGKIDITFRGALLAAMRA